jgi:hypothetical protein
MHRELRHPHALTQDPDALTDGMYGEWLHQTSPATAAGKEILLSTTEQKQIIPYGKSRHGSLCSLTIPPQHAF